MENKFEQVMEDLRRLLVILPEEVRKKIESNGNEAELLEVVMDLGRKPVARYVSGEKTLQETEVTQAEIDMVSAVSGISMMTIAPG